MQNQPGSSPLPQQSWRQSDAGYQQPPSQPLLPQQPQWQPGPYQQPPFQQPPPQKKKSKLPLILGIVTAILVLSCVGVVATAALSSSSTPNTATVASTDTTNQQSTSQATQPPATAKPTQPPKWTTVQNFNGNGSKKTAVFAVPDDWKLSWTCNHSSYDNLDYNVVIVVYNSDGSLADSGVNAICKTNATSGNSEEHVSGNVYLDIISEGDWTIQVQELK